MCSSDLQKARASRWENTPSWSRGAFNAGSRGTSTYTRSTEPIRKTGANYPRTTSPASSVKPPTTSAVKDTGGTSQFKALDKVRHPSWGEGTILESKIEGGDEILTVQFKSVGLKKLVAGMTKLVKLNH